MTTIPSSVATDGLPSEDDALDFTCSQAEISCPGPCRRTSVGSRISSIYRHDIAVSRPLGYDVPVYLRTAEEMARIATAPPFPDVHLQKPASLLVTFFDGEVPKALEAASNDVDVLRADGRELYWLARLGVAKTTLDWRPVEKHLTDLGTNRNMTTVRALTARLARSGVLDSESTPGHVGEPAHAGEKWSLSTRPFRVRW